MTDPITRRAFTIGATSTLGLFTAGQALAQTGITVEAGAFDVAHVAPGEKHFAYVNVVRHAAANVDVPVGIVNGAADGPTIAVTGGIFGTEYSGIEAASRLYRDLEPRGLNGRVIIVPVVNMPAFQFRTPAYNLRSGNSPIDGKSINTVFPGQADGNVSEAIAYFIFNALIKSSDYVVDLRGGDLPENHLVHTMFASEGSEEVRRVSREMAMACGFPYHQSRSQRPGSLFWESCNAGIPSIITQSGLGFRTQPEEQFVRNHVRGVSNIMKYFDMMDGEPEIDVPQRELSSEFVSIKAKHNGVFQATREIGEVVRRGDVLGKITELDGSVQEEIVTERDGVLHTYFVRRVVMTGDTLAYVVPLV